MAFQANAFQPTAFQVGGRKVTWWNPIADMDLSNGGLTTTARVAGTNCRSKSNIVLTGKTYVELKIESGLTGNVPGMGICNTTEAGPPGIDLDSVSWSVAFGDIFLNSVGFGNIGVGANLDILSVATDRDAKLVWMRRNGGLWNNSATANPATGTGGIDFTVLGAGDIFIYCYGGSTSASVTAAFGADTYVYGAPAGFLPLGDSPDLMPAMVM